MKSVKSHRNVKTGHTLGNVRHKLTLDRPATYEIRVPGQLDKSWLQWNEGITVRVEGEEDWLDTTLIVTVDQAALQGLLRRLYSIGLPLISVICVQYSFERRQC